MKKGYVMVCMLLLLVSTVTAFSLTTERSGSCALTKYDGEEAKDFYVEVNEAECSACVILKPESKKKPQQLPNPFNVKQDDGSYIPIFQSIYSNGQPAYCLTGIEYMKLGLQSIVIEKNKIIQDVLDDGHINWTLECDGVQQNDIFIQEKQTGMGFGANVSVNGSVPCRYIGSSDLPFTLSGTTFTHRKQDSQFSHTDHSIDFADAGTNIIAYDNLTVTFDCIYNATLGMCVVDPLVTETASNVGTFINTQFHPFDRWENLVDISPIARYYSSENITDMAGLDEGQPNTPLGNHLFPNNEIEDTPSDDQYIIVMANTDFDQTAWLNAIISFNIASNNLDAGEQFNVSIHHVYTNHSWNESNITWNGRPTAGNDYNATWSDNILITDSTTGWISFDISEIITTEKGKNVSFILIPHSQIGVDASADFVALNSESQSTIQRRPYIRASNITNGFWESRPINMSDNGRLNYGHNVTINEDTIFRTTPQYNGTHSQLLLGFGPTGINVSERNRYVNCSDYNLSLFYDFDGDTVTDYCNVRTPPTLVGLPDFIEEKEEDRAINFSGTTQGIRVAWDNNMNCSAQGDKSQVFFATSVYLETNPTQEYELFDNYNQQAMFLRMLTGRTMRFIVRSGGGTKDTTGIVVNLKQWTPIALTHNSTHSALWINGTLHTLHPQAGVLDVTRWKSAHTWGIGVDGRFDTLDEMNGAVAYAAFGCSELTPSIIKDIADGVIFNWTKYDTAQTVTTDTVMNSYSYGYDTFPPSAGVPDTAPPNVTCSNPPNGQVNTTSNEIALTCTSTDPGDCKLLIDNKVNQTKTATADTPLTILTNLSYGSYTWGFNCSDAAGNENKSEVRTITLTDQTPPTVALIAPNTATVNFSGAIDFRYNVTDNPFSTIDNCSLLFYGSINDTDDTITKDTEQTFTKNLNRGTYNWSVNCTDQADNSHVSPSRILTIAARNVSFPVFFQRIPDVVISGTAQQEIFTFKFNTSEPNTTLTVRTSMSLRKLTGALTNNNFINITIDNVTVSSNELSSTEIGGAGVDNYRATASQPGFTTVANGEHEVKLYMWEIGTGDVEASNFHLILGEALTNRDTAVTAKTIPVSYEFSSTTPTPAFNWTLEKVINSSTFISSQLTIRSDGETLVGVQMDDGQLSSYTARYQSSADSVGTAFLVQVEADEIGDHVHTILSETTAATVNINGSINYFDLRDNESNLINHFGVSNPLTNRTNHVTLTAGNHLLTRETKIIYNGTSYFMIAEVSFNSSERRFTPTFKINSTGTPTNCSTVKRTINDFLDRGSLLMVGECNSFNIGDSVDLELWVEIPVGNTVTIIDEFLAGSESTTIDTETINTPPSCGIISPDDPANVTGIIPVNFTCSDTQGTDFVINVTADSTPIGINLPVGTINVTFNSSILADGTYNLTVTAIEVEGAEPLRTNTSHEIFIDNTAPVVTLNRPVGTYNDTAQTILFNCSAADNFQVKNISFYITNASNASFSLDTAGVFDSGDNNSLAVSKTLDNGNYTWNCLGCDPFGNCAWSANKTLLLNVTNPDFGLPFVQLINPGDGSTVVNNSVPFSCRGYDNATDISSVQLYGNFSGSWQGNVTNSTTPGLNNTIVTFPTTLTEGFYKWNCRVCDSASNCGFAPTNFTVGLVFPSFNFNISAGIEWIKMLF